MIRITVIDREHRQDIRLPNEPFALTGRIVPSYVNERWSYAGAGGGNVLSR